MTLKAIRLILSLTFLLAGTSWSRESYIYYAHKISTPAPPAGFRLTGPEGRPFSLGRPHGKLTLLTFGFTHCPNTCPTTLANLARIYERLSKEDKERVEILFVTIDPERDTTNVLQSYVRFFDPGFIGLTGESKQIATISAFYGAEYEKTKEKGGGPDDYTMDHSAAVYLLMPSGSCAAYYFDAQLSQSERVANDLKHFLALPAPHDTEWQSEQQSVVKTPVLSASQLYVEHCASCHSVNGAGVAGKYPALAGSSWVTGAPNRVTALVLDGVREKGGGNNGRVMPAWWKVMTPGDLAEVLTYTRMSWGNSAPAISATYVKDLAYRYSSHRGFWSMKELAALPPEKDARAPGAR
ncbi:MAG: SCO family protein [Chthoniobacterales bacterium]|nr:SCO family protein [Chthoniobacterales bacterium]